MLLRQKKDWIGLRWKLTPLIWRKERERGVGYRDALVSKITRFSTISRLLFRSISNYLESTPIDNELDRHRINLFAIELDRIESIPWKH